LVRKKNEHKKKPELGTLFNPVLDCMKFLGRPITIAEMESIVSLNMDIAQFFLLLDWETHMTPFGINLGWARFYLKKAGYINNLKHGVWSLTKKGSSSGPVSPADIKKLVRKSEKIKR